jgi:hypothetical protein
MPRKSKVAVQPSPESEPAKSAESVNVMPGNQSELVLSWMLDYACKTRMHSLIDGRFLFVCFFGYLNIFSVGTEA